MELNRKQFLHQLAVVTGTAAVWPSSLLTAQETAGLREMIQLIGNANDERQRTELLAQALMIPGISDEEKDILDKLFNVSDRWANGFTKYANPGSEGNESSGYLCSFLSRVRIDRNFLPETSDTHPLYPLLSFYRARMLLAQLIQSGEISMVPQIRDRYLAECNKLMQYAQSAFPENTLIKNYLGEFIPWSDLVDPDPHAPEWANHQRMVLEKLTLLIHWWIDNRQITDGQFGGGWGDDVEMWRSWIPVLFAFEDKKAVDSQQKLFEGLYRLSRMQKGYTTILNDVEHTSEEYSDPLFCMLNLQPENPKWESRALHVMDYIENLWSGINVRGNLQFKSTWFNAEKVDLDVKRACDTPYHTRLVQPLMLLWLRTGNERIGRFVIRWLTTWVEATFTAEKGKPEGIVPAAIHWPDGTPSGTGKNWWQPENYGSPLYDYPSQQSMMYECFLQAYHMTRNTFFLKPFRFIAEKRLEGVGSENPDSCLPGSLEWCIASLRNTVPEMLSKYRLITDDSSFDILQNNDSAGYELFLTGRDINLLTREMEKQKTSLSLPVDFYTSEVRWTDRLFAFNGKYFRYVLKNPLPGYDPDFLFSSLTGNIGNFRILPVFGVQWLTNPTEIAIIAEENSTISFKAQLYHFGKQPRKMSVRFLNLQKGTYTWSLQPGHSGIFEISAENRILDFILLPRKLCRFEVSLRKAE